MIKKTLRLAVKTLHKMAKKLQKLYQQARKKRTPEEVTSSVRFFDALVTLDLTAQDLTTAIA